MYREVKIVIGIFLVYFFYALTSYFELGSFLAPFFFNKIILVFTSLFFLLINIRVKGSGFLILTFLAFISEALMDEFTIRFLSGRLGFGEFAVWAENPNFIITTFLFFFGFLFVSIFILRYYIKNWWLLISLIAIIVFNLILLFNNQPIARDISLNIYFLIYFAIAIRSKADEKSILIPISALFLLHALLAIFKFVFV